VKRRPIVVTRAGDAGQDLSRALAEAGEETLWLPAFVFGPAPDENRAAEVLGGLSDYQLAIFVSPAAVEATAARLTQPWPTGTAMAAVGEGTRRAILARIPAAARAALLAPAGIDAEGEGGGSEALWQVLRPVLGHTRRALILRAEHGREWLAEQLAGAGVEVETLAVYTRRPAPVSPEAAARIRGWKAAGQSPVLVVASSEAVETLISQLDPIVGAEWARSAFALASHERIAQHLRAAGFEVVKVATFDVEAIRKATFAK
jgi:uroporphyrinogen-III synthase